MKLANRIVGLAVLVVAQLAIAQQQQQLSIGENTKLNAGGLFIFGYNGGYGDFGPSNHGLNFGFDGKISGSYYNPNFISFTATPYYNQSRADSNSQSITGASGVVGTANFFTGSKFPGSVQYHYDRNSTGTFGLTGQPNFTTYGSGHGIAINWSELVPDWPTLTVGYSQNAGHSTLYGTDQEADSSTRLFSLHSNYNIAGFLLTGYFDHTNVSSQFPEFLAGEGASTMNSSGHDFGVGAQHNLPENGSLAVTYTRSSATNTDLSSTGQNDGSLKINNYTYSTENANAIFHPTTKLSWNVTQTYTNNLSGYLAQNLSGTGSTVTGVNLGSGSYSSTIGGGANYNITHYLSASAQATYYDQHYLGQSYSGQYLSGTLNCSKRFLDTFSFSASVIDSSNGQGQNALGFVGNVNAFRRFGNWVTSGQFSYAQNVQTLLITYTSSYYNYSANVNRRLVGNLRWTAAFSGSHSGLTHDVGSSTHSESYSTSLSMRRISANATFSQAHGVSLLGAAGVINPSPTPGLSDLILFNGSNYGGGISATPIKRLTLSGSFSRGISNTIAATESRNNTEVFNAQMQYHMRQIGLNAGYTRFTQGISAIGAPVNSTTYFVGISRWFDFF